MRWLYILIFLPFCGDCQPLASLTFSNNSIYLFCRGTKSKAGLVSRQYNLADTNISHVGIGFYDGGAPVIYHVTDVQGYDHALRVDSIASFTGTGDVYYFGVWECRTSTKKVNTLRNILRSYEKLNIVFDISFRLSHDDTLYCSEFCARVLSILDRKKFNFKPTEKKLNALYSRLLKRDQLIYYPVDFFIPGGSFKKFYEIRISME